MDRRVIALALAACMCATPFGADAAKPPKKPAGGAPALTIVARPTIVTFGGAATVSGRLTGRNHSNRPVGLQRNPWPFRAFVDTKRVTRTASNGSYSFRVQPARHTRYRVVTPQPA